MKAEAKEEKKIEPLKTDPNAPDEIRVSFDGGEISETLVAKKKHFSTGSVGYFCSGKLTNPESGERYQVSMTVTLIGSKPK